MNRRQFTSAASLAAASATVLPLSSAAALDQPTPFRYCLNTATIAGQKLSLAEQIRVTAEAGYDGIEVWTRDVHAAAKSDRELAALNRQVADANLTIDSAIGFARWIVDDPAERRQGLIDAERDMAAVRAIGGTRIAAPPAGATRPIDLDRVAERYRALVEVGRRVGVTPQLELWGHSPALSRIGQLLYVAAESGCPEACLLPDVYHIYKGGSSFEGLGMVDGSRIHVFHMNDYPADPPREEIADQHRVYPGDGVAPIGQIVRGLEETGFRGVFSLELFNRQYWEEDALAVARTGLKKMKEAVGG